MDVYLGTPNLWPLLLGGRCSGVTIYYGFRNGIQNGGH
jgi:hypothetical protein